MSAKDFKRLNIINLTKSESHLRKGLRIMLFLKIEAKIFIEQAIGRMFKTMTNAVVSKSMLILFSIFKILFEIIEKTTTFYESNGKKGIVLKKNLNEKNPCSYNILLK